MSEENRKLLYEFIANVNKCAKRLKTEYDAKTVDKLEQLCLEALDACDEEIATELAEQIAAKQP